MNVTVSHGATRYGRYTDLSYTDAAGHPMMSRFAGIFNEPEAIALLTWLRNNDRNRIGAAQ